MIALQEDGCYCVLVLNVYGRSEIKRAKKPETMSTLIRRWVAGQTFTSPPLLSPLCMGEGAQLWLPEPSTERMLKTCKTNCQK